MTRPYDIDNPPRLERGDTVESRAAWADSLIPFLASLGAAVGLDPARQEIEVIVDAIVRPFSLKVVATGERMGVITGVLLSHPLLLVAVYADGDGDIALGYRAGPESAIGRQRDPDSVQYVAVFRDATTPTARGLLTRLRYLAGL